jgi:hypothetical protein
MNIFVLDYTPEKAAEYHCDKHVVKMIVETAQILSTVHHVLGQGHDGIYRKTHENHPCSVWARKSDSNYSWLLRLGQALIEEYGARYKKTHKTSAVINKLSSIPENIDKIGFTPFALAMPEKFHSTDAVDSYRRYYLEEKAHIAKWKYSETPRWFSNE